jgi:hypothetical protein
MSRDRQVTGYKLHVEELSLQIPGYKLFKTRAGWSARAASGRKIHNGHAPLDTANRLKGQGDIIIVVQGTLYEGACEGMGGHAA